MSCMTKIVPIPNSACRRHSSTSTWIGTVASSAVVGSSASSTRGEQDSAVAIMARCRNPPESSCGKASTWARAWAGSWPCGAVPSGGKQMIEI